MTDYKWHWMSNQVSIPIPDEYALTAMRMLLIERLKVRMFLMAKVVDGGKEIRLPLNYGKGGKP